MSFKTFVDEIGIDRLRAIADQQAEMMHFARLAGLQHQTDPRARAGANQMMMQAGGGEQRRNRRMAAIDSFVGQDQESSRRRRSLGPPL